jgi:uncharacterized protein YacL
MSHFLQIGMGRTFSVVFLALSVLLMGLASYQFVDGLGQGKELISIFVQSVNTGIIALAIFELGIGIGKEYANSEQHEHTFFTIRRMVARFVGTVCIALVLESLIMIIKYSQLDLAGNLFYPVGILAASSVMLCSLGVFLHFSRADCEVHGRLARTRSNRANLNQSLSEQHGQQRPRKTHAARSRH